MTIVIKNWFYSLNVSLPLHKIITIYISLNTFSKTKRPVQGSFSYVQKELILVFLSNNLCCS